MLDQAVLFEVGVFVGGVGFGGEVGFVVQHVVKAVLTEVEFLGL